MDDSLPKGAIMLLVTLVVVLITALVGGAFVGAFGILGTPETTVSPDTGSFVEVDSTINEVPDSTLVKSSSGHALRFDEGDYVQAEIDGNIDQGDWTVCSYVEVAEDASPTSTMDIASAANGSIQLEYDAGSWMIFYDNGTSTAVLKANATSPKTPTTVCARNTGDQITLWENGTQVASSTLSNATGTRNVSVTLSGVADEIRWSNSSVSSAMMSDYAANPTIPFDGTDRAARFMFDEGQGSTTTVYYAGTSADIVGASWTDGVEGRTLQNGTDYTWSEEPWSIKLLSGSDYAGAPALTIEYAGSHPYSSSILSIQSNFATAIVLFGVSLLVIPAMAVIVLIRDGELGELLNTNSGGR